MDKGTEGIRHRGLSLVHVHEVHSGPLLSLCHQKVFDNVTQACLRDAFPHTADVSDVSVLEGVVWTPWLSDSLKQ